MYLALRGISFKLPSARVAQLRMRATDDGPDLVMTGVAVFAGIEVATLDDGQAGFAVVYVPMVAFPLVGVVRACQVVEARLRSGGPDRLRG